MITIIGGGISGITTGLTLQLLGCETEIYAEHLVGVETNDEPCFASDYPAASVIPHSVQTDRLAALFTDSLRVFGSLYDKEFSGLKLHRHYEIFEFSVEEPEYTRYLQNYAAIDQVADSLIPKRKGISELFGWAFDCYVAEWPVYIKKLYDLYIEKGGDIYIKKLGQDEICNLTSDIIINCSGVWSNQLFNDDEKIKIIRGHIIHALDKSKVRDSRGRICSYNYTPEPSVYATPAGEPCDVYFYPIGNKWLMGGSRQQGTIGENQKWIGSDIDDTILVDEIEIPSQIIALNDEILENTYHSKIPSEQKLKSFIGYRFNRGGNGSGLRLERTEEMGKTVIHNYGHGGAGVTLSWGCALQVARLLNVDAAANDILILFD